MRVQPLSDRELASMFIEYFQDVGEDTVTILGMQYSLIEMLRDHDPIAFNTTLNDFVDSLVEEGQLFELNGEYYDDNPNEEEFV